jgi:replicative DNA helicase
VGLISGSNPNASRYETVTQISQQLKVMARDLKVPVIALAQLNREVENRKDSKPMLSDLRDSGSLEQDADVVILLRRDSAQNRNVITLDVAKNRHGETQTLDLGFQGEYSRATNHQIK